MMLMQRCSEVFKYSCFITESNIVRFISSVFLRKQGRALPQPPRRAPQLKRPRRSKDIEAKGGLCWSCDLGVGNVPMFRKLEKRY